MDNITIPPEAVRAYREACQREGTTAQDVLAAAINAWPGLKVETSLIHNERREHSIILPLTETPHD